VGCERGVHFYAMEYIDGQNLGEMIADLRHQSPTRKGAAPNVASSPSPPYAGERGRGEGG